MKDILSFLQNLPQMVTIVIISFLGAIALLILGLIIHAYRSGRKIKIWNFEIEGKSNTEENLKARKEKSTEERAKIQDILQNKQQPITSRFCLLGSKTWDIDDSQEKLNSIKYFYTCFVQAIDRTPYGFNACGAEPWREIFHDHYCKKLYVLSKAQIEEIQDKVCWYWFPGDDLGFNYEPAFYHSVKTPNAKERLIAEVKNSDLILALAGRTGTKNQVELLLKYHQEKKHQINFHTKIFMPLAWFGGTIKEFIEEHRKELEPYLSLYPELEPDKELSHWDTDQKLLKESARKLANSIIRLLSEKSK